MSYLTLNRVITFLAGIGLLYAAKKVFESAQDFVYTNVFYVLSALLLLLGMYIVIASLVPYKKTTKEVSEIVFEGLFHIVIEIIFRSIIRIFVAIFHFITH